MMAVATSAVSAINRLSLCLPFICLILILVQSAQLPSNGSRANPTVAIEGCLDDGCMAILTAHFTIISPCFDSLRETIPPDDEEYSQKLCCNVGKYEKCLFPYIISYCGMESLDKFDAELKGLNSQCSIATLQWSKCVVNKTVVEEDNLELRE